MGLNSSISIFKFKREFEKRFRGYISETILYTTYPFRRKREPIRRFIILSYPRTGSNLLVDLLGSHPLIQCENEILINKLLFPRRYIDFRSNLSNKEVYGFKLQSHHMDLQKIRDQYGFIQNLLASGFSFIKLKRRNLYRTALSLVYARDSGKFHYTKSYGEHSYPKITVDPQELLERIQWMENQSELIDQLIYQIPHLDLIYEDHLLDSTNQQATANLVFEYLGVPYFEVRTKFIKMRSEDISLYVENAPELRRVIKMTKYAHFLDQAE